MNNREIKFRALYDGVWYYQTLEESLNINLAAFRLGKHITQYTGLKDKTGKEIFEGDILEFDSKEWGSNKDNKWVVGWNKEDGCWDTGGGTTSECKSFKIIIGNIYENPELYSGAVGV